MKPQVKVELLGQLRVRSGPTVLDAFRTKKAASLLAYLAYHRHRHHPRELLIDILWPDAEPESGRNSFSITLTRLRQELEAAGLPADIVVAQQSAVYLNPAGITTDVEALTEALQQAARVQTDD